MSQYGKLNKLAEHALETVVQEGIFATGGQIAVTIGGKMVVDIATGNAGGGPEMMTRHLHNVYCLCKPIPYLLLGHALDDRAIEPDNPLHDVLALPSWIPVGLTYRQLAAHDAALGEPSSIAWLMTPPCDRQTLLDQIDTSGEPSYSEITGGLIAEYIIEYMTGRPPNRYCFEELLQPNQLTEEIIIDSELALAARDRIQVPVIGLPVDPLPMLSQLLPTHIGETRLAIGAYATMHGVARLFAAIGQVMAGRALPGLPSPGFLNKVLADDGPLRHDPFLHRPAKWAAGLMTDLRNQEVAQAAGPSAVGHTTGLANSAALYDPSRKASIAVYLNGMGAHHDDHHIPRRQLINKVLDAIPAI